MKTKYHTNTGSSSSKLKKIIKKKKINYQDQRAQNLHELGHDGGGGGGRGRGTQIRTALDPPLPPIPQEAASFYSLHLRRRGSGGGYRGRGYTGEETRVHAHRGDGRVRGYTVPARPNLNARGLLIHTI